MDNKKFACMVVDSDKDFGEMMRQSEDMGVERGLKATLTTPMFKELSYMFDRLSQNGYHITGFILSENKEIEFLYHRNPNQTPSQKLKEVEIKDKYSL